ncbi:hypothetical protein BJ138DRAFT_1012445 [Hygrophoropsis aurantiaca]|uniref:Uncharacterized protein n=1 Tax=Hygrophoropsis aurantiaca TaxID=72124 RepID=A0ACB8A524_9AGAM|nr:hypothetical protein BJ138DRAFT_1012445 [Hygrophoropsis aurantiaca]
MEAQDNNPSPEVLLPNLQDKIQALTEFQTRFRALRHIPALFLKAPANLSLGSQNFPTPFDQSVNQDFFGVPTHDFRAIKEVAESLLSEKVQDALRTAELSRKSDKSELSTTFRTESRKRKRPLSPVGSPQPYIPPLPRSSSLFPPSEDEPLPLRAEILLSFIREFNANRTHQRPNDNGSESIASSCRLHIWSRTHIPSNNSAITSAAMSATQQRLPKPLIVRLTIPDVLTAYISLLFEREDDPLVVESVTAFGPREKKLPHMQSDYLAFQVLSQHVAKMVQSYPRVPFQTLIHLLNSYQGLFVDRCSGCERVLSADGHVPPVGRVWVVDDSSTRNPKPDEKCSTSESKGGVTNQGHGHWDPRHVTC